MGPRNSGRTGKCEAEHSTARQAVTLEGRRGPNTQGLQVKERSDAKTQRVVNNSGSLTFFKDHLYFKSLQDCYRGKGLERIKRKQFPNERACGSSEQDNGHGNRSG